MDELINHSKYGNYSGFIKIYNSFKNKEKIFSSCIPEIAASCLDNRIFIFLHFNGLKNVEDYFCSSCSNSNMDLFKIICGKLKKISFFKRKLDSIKSGLMWLVREEKNDFLEYFLENFSKFKNLDFYKELLANTLASSCRYKIISAIRILVDYGAYSKNALIEAVGNVECVKAVFYNSDPAHEDYYGNTYNYGTALYTAFSRCDENCIDFLIMFSNVKYLDSNGRNLLMVSCERNPEIKSDFIIKYLKYFDINHIDANGYTLYHLLLDCLYSEEALLYIWNLEDFNKNILDEEGKNYLFTYCWYSREKNNILKIMLNYYDINGSSSSNNIFEETIEKSDQLIESGERFESLIDVIDIDDLIVFSFLNSILRERNKRIFLEILSRLLEKMDDNQINTFFMNNEIKNIIIDEEIDIILNFIFKFKKYVIFNKLFDFTKFIMESLKYINDNLESKVVILEMVNHINDYFN